MFSAFESWGLAAAFFALVCFWRGVSLGAEPGEPSGTDRAGPGGWKLTDLASSMQTVPGRSYENGRRLFDRAHCTTCHRQDNVGNEFGPDLTRLDPRFQPLDILRDILDPSRRMADAKYDTWIFQTDAGLTVKGLIHRETDQAVSVMEKPLALAPPIVVPKAEIVERTMSLTSIMPQGLLDGLTRDEVCDLIAYVAARGIRGARDSPTNGTSLTSETSLRDTGLPAPRRGGNGPKSVLGPTGN